MKSLVYICSSQSTEVENSETSIIFPNLKIVKISGMDKLMGWHQKNDKLLAFPRLDELTMIRCSQIRTIPYAPLLRNLHVLKSKGIKPIEISNLVMAAEAVLDIDCESGMEKSAFRPPKNAVKMTVTKFENVIALEEVEEESYQTLRYLTMVESNCFFSCRPSKLALGFWKYFASLETLIIINCNDLSIWPEQEFKSLKCLKKLTFYGCKFFSCLSEVSPSSSIKSYMNDILPRLENLQILECPKFVEIPWCCKSLKALALRSCPSVSKEGLSWLKNLRELKMLQLCNCEGSKSFPEGLQQRLSAFQYLHIGECPVLEKRCRSGGDYHHLVSAIPQLSLGG